MKRTIFLFFLLIENVFYCDHVKIQCNLPQRFQKTNKTLTKKCLSPAKNRIMKELYGIDMEAEGQYSKLIDEIPVPDIAISMGCNVGCPFIERPFDDNWGLEDPTGKSDEEFKKVIDEIRMQIFILKQRLDEFEEN